MSSYCEKQLKKKRGKLCPEVGAGSLFPPTVDENGVRKAAPHIMPKGDVRRVPGQNFIVYSYATPDGTTAVRSPRGMVIKFSGCFDKVEDACKHAKDIAAEDTRFDVFVSEMYEWGTVYLPKDEAPFVRRKYADEMLTRIVSGLQDSMEQGKREMDERKERDRRRAEEAMRAAKHDPDYVMPEKSDMLKEYEKKVEEERSKAVAERGEYALVHTEQDISNIAMQFFVQNAGAVIDAGTGAAFMKYFIEKTVEREAQLARARDHEKPDTDPKNIPAQMKEALETGNAGAAASSKTDDDIVVGEDGKVVIATKEDEK
jgi:hypothetical protein